MKRGIEEQEGAKEKRRYNVLKGKEEQQWREEERGGENFILVKQKGWKKGVWKKRDKVVWKRKFHAVLDGKAGVSTLHK